MPSTAVYVVEVTLLSLISLGLSAYVLFFYVKNNWRSIERWILCVLLLSVWVCLTPFALLLVDVDSASRNHSQETASWMPLLWSFVFWSTQVLSWVVLPIIQEYASSGEFTPCRRFFHSIRLNVTLYIAMGLASALLLVYVWFVKGLHSQEELVSVVLAAANAFGLSLIILFLAYGMASVPKKIWRRGDIRRTLEFLYWQVPRLQDDLESAQSEWRESVATLREAVVHPELPDELKGCYEQMQAAVKAFEATEWCQEGGKKSTTDVFGHARDHDPSRRPDAVKLHSELKRSMHNITRLKMRWRHLQQTCIDLEDIVAFLHEGSGEKFCMKRIYWRYLRKYGLRSWASVMFGMSLVVAWSEFTLPMSSKELGDLNLSAIAHIMDVRGSRTTWCAAFLSFMAFHTYWSVFQFKLFNSYVLTAGHSDTCSLCFTVVFLTRLIMPLCYNFLHIAHLIDGTGFSKVFGELDVVDFLGPWFNRFYPMLVLVVYAIIVTNVFNVLLALCGVTTFEVRGDVEDDKVVEGRQIIQRIRQSLQPPDVYSSPLSSPRSSTKKIEMGGQSLDDYVNPSRRSGKKSPKRTVLGEEN